MMDTRRWSTRENDRVLDEIAQRQQSLKKTVRTHRRNDNEFCLHDRLMSEIKRERILKPIGRTRDINVNTDVHASSLVANQSFVDSSRKRIRPVQVRRLRERLFSTTCAPPLQELAESDLSSDDEQRDEHGRKRVAVIDCLLESSPDDQPDGRLLLATNPLRSRLCLRR
jgi:hypothetical protein